MFLEMSWFLFCILLSSDLPTTVNIPMEEELKGQKRNGSLSLLVECNTTCVKKQCIIDQSSPPLKSSKFESSSKPEDVVRFEVLDVSSDKPFCQILCFIDD